jgi:hypothetical protein
MSCIWQGPTLLSWSCTPMDTSVYLQGKTKDMPNPELLLIVREVHTGTSIGIATVLPRLLGIAGFTQVRHLTHVQDFSMGSESWMDCYRNQEVLNVTMMPLLVQAGLISQEEIDTLNQHILIERNAEDFCGMGYFHTVLATKAA